MNPTDTNQANEDVLIELATKFDMDEYGTVNENGGYLIGEVRKLIRTEKLKLLAEVKSSLTQMKELKENRDDKGVLWGSYDVVDLDDIREALTKLEAEL